MVIREKYMIYYCPPSSVCRALGGDQSLQQGYYKRDYVL